MKRMRLDSNGGKEIPAESSSSRKLCEDLLEEIFSRLPARSAARCAALSKRWREFITAPDFWLHHHRPPPPGSSVAYVHEYAAEHDGGQKSLQHALHHVGPCSSCVLAQGFLSSARHGLKQRYVGTCNGLVALEVQGLYNPRFFTCAVLNPATAEEASLVYLGLAGEAQCYCLRGFGYGPGSKTYKFLVVRRRDPLSGGPLQVVSLGGGDARGEAQTVFPELDGDHAFSLCIGGQVYLLDSRKRRVLIFDVDGETIRSVQLPPAAAAAAAGAVLCSELMEVRGRPCVAVQDGQTHEVALWLLTASLDWQRRRCVMGQVAPSNLMSHCWLVGAWDCGGNRLLVWFRGEGLRLYDVDPRETSGSARLPAGRWTLEDQTGSSSWYHRRWGYGQYRLCWGYRPTAVPPRIAIGNCTGAASPVLCHFQSGRRTPERPTMRFVNVISGLVTTLLAGKELHDVHGG